MFQLADSDQGSGKKLPLNLRILYFSVTVLVLTALGLAIARIPPEMPVSKELLLFLWVVAAPVVVVLVFRDSLIAKNKVNIRKLLLLTVSAMLISVLATQSVLAIATPIWTFSVTTDKPVYRLGETVTFTVVLRNMGLVPHCFRSRLSELVVVSVVFPAALTEDPFAYTVWDSPYHYHNITHFWLGPLGSLERHITWNQTRTVNIQYIHSGLQIEPGVYRVLAQIPNDHLNEPLFSIPPQSSMPPLFYAWSTFNVTST